MKGAMNPLQFFSFYEDYGKLTSGSFSVISRINSGPILSCRIQRIPQSHTRRPYHLVTMCPVLSTHPYLPMHQRYTPESDLKEDPEEDDKDPEEDPADYPTDRDDDEEEEESFEDEADEEEEDKEEEDEQEEEHPALTDSIPPPLVHRTTARISIPVQAPTPLWSEADINRLLAIPSPPPSPLSACYFPSTTTYCTSTYQGICGHAKSCCTIHYILAPRSETPPSGTPPLLPIPLPTSSPSLLLPSTSHRLDVLEFTLPPQKRLCIALGLRYKVGESSYAPTARPIRGYRADYGFVATLDDKIRCNPDRDVGYGITDTWDEMLETDEIYGRLDDAQDDRLLMSGQLNMLHRDKRAHARTARLIETEARLSRPAWVQSMDDSNTARAKVMSLRTTVLAQQLNIIGLRAAYRTRQTQLAEKMAPKRTTRSTPATTTTTTTTTVTDAQLKALIDQGVANTLANVMLTEAKMGTEGVVELTHWFERMETVFHISNCTVENQIKFATCTLLKSALTWWNSHVKNVGPDVAYAMTSTYLKKKMTNKYCPRGEIKKLEVELWNLKVKESDKIKRYIGGLPDMIYRSVMTSKPKIIQDVIEFTTELMDKKISTLAER
nr:hypothetical protein [Tanacetum cinerariifolium]